MHRLKHRKRFALIALNIVIVLIVAGGTTAYGALSKTVTVTIDGKTETIRSFGGKVADVLAARDIEVTAADVVSPLPAASLQDGQDIEVKYMRPVTVTVDGSTTKTRVYDPTVGDALDSLGVQPHVDAWSDAEPTDPLPREGADIVVSNPKDITVVADGKKRQVTTAAPTVKGVLEAANVTLDDDDELDARPDDFVKPGQDLKVVRIDTQTRTEQVEVAFTKQTKPDASMPKGEVKVVTPGVAGTTSEKVFVTLADGKVRDRDVLESAVVRAPVAQVERVGTKVAETTGNSVWDKIAKCESGGNWHINTGNGYYGGLQFSAATWHSVGGPGLPHQQSRETQIKYAKILQARSGWGQWGCAGARFN